MTLEELKTLEEIVSKATPGPWTATDWGSTHPHYPEMQTWFVSTPDAKCDYWVGDNADEIEPNHWNITKAERDCTFIAAFNPLVVRQLLTLAKEALDAREADDKFDRCS